MQAYLDNAATTPLHPEVKKAMQAVMDEFGNPSSIHAWGRRSRILIEKARTAIAEQLGVAPGEIFFTSGGTEAINTAIYGAVVDRHVTTIITSPIEHKAVLKSVNRMQAIRPNVTVHYIRHQSDGTFDPAAVETLLKKSPRGRTLVALMHANNELGVLNDAAAIGALARQYDALYLCDTVQTLCHIPFQLPELGAHYAACSAHKFHGPKGVGFFYMSHAAKVKPLIWGGAQERGMRAGTENVMGIVGLHKAFEVGMEALRTDPEHILRLRTHLRDQIRTHIPEATVWEPRNGKILPTVLSVAFPLNEKTEMLQMRLDMEGVAVSAGSACTSGAAQRSHVLDALDAPADIVPIRFSFGNLTTLDDVNYAVAVLRKIMG